MAERQDALAELADLEGQLAQTQIYNHYMAKELGSVRTTLREEKWGVTAPGEGESSGAGAREAGTRERRERDERAARFEPSPRLLSPAGGRGELAGAYERVRLAAEGDGGLPTEGPERWISGEAARAIQ